MASDGVKIGAGLAEARPGCAPASSRSAEAFRWERAGLPNSLAHSLSLRSPHFPSSFPEKAALEAHKPYTQEIFWLHSQGSQAASWDLAARFSRSR